MDASPSSHSRDCKKEYPHRRHAPAGLPSEARLDDDAGAPYRPGERSGTSCMSLLEPGGIDCDIHPAVPNIRALHPYLSDHWRDIVVQRGVHELESIAYPANSPLTSRPDWRLANGKPGSDLDALRAHALTPFGTSIAICNCLYGVQLLFSEDMGAGFAHAVNDWMAREWLDKEPRLCASIVVPMQNPELAVEEINRVAPDRRFVQILLLVMHDHP